MEQEIRRQLEELGIRVSEEAFQQALSRQNQSSAELGWMSEYMPELMKEFSQEQSADGFDWMDEDRPELMKEPFALTLLKALGMGVYDAKSNTWTPLSDQIYGFDAEVDDIEGMYTRFFRGISRIVDDAEFTDIEEQEDLLVDVIEENGRWCDGSRTVSFRCNGHEYSLKLASYCDWFNEEMILFVNKVLRQEGCRGQLLPLSSGGDQIILIFYGCEEQAEAIVRLIGQAV